MKKRKVFRKNWRDRRAKKIQNSMSKDKISKVKIRKEEKNISYEANLIDYFLEKKFYDKVKCRSKARMDIPASFTFYEDIENTLLFLRNIVYMISKKSLKELFLNHTCVEKISLTASLILDLILMEAAKYVQGTKYRKDLNICGEVKKDTDVGILIHANGVLPHLGFEVERDPNVRTLDMIYGDMSNCNTLDPASDILKYFGECLKMQGCSLTKPGKRAFGKLLGELIDNCRLHIGKSGKWYALGFYHNKESHGKCHIAILTVGDTIYESLTKAGNVTDETYSALKNKTDKHKKYFDNGWNEETLWTWLSLQHGVSRLRNSKIEKDSNRGQGTVDIMEGFQQIGQSIEGVAPVFTIVSGHTMICFDFEKYPIKQVIVNGDERRIISFNKENDLDVKPDSKYVKKMNTYFPGTIYTMEFYIDPKYLENSDQMFVRRGI